MSIPLIFSAISESVLLVIRAPCCEGAVTASDRSPFRKQTLVFAQLVEEELLDQDRLRRDLLGHQTRFGDQAVEQRNVGVGQQHEALIAWLRQSCFQQLPDSPNCVSTPACSAGTSG